MTAESLPFVPPAPTVHPTDLSVWRLLWKITRSTVSIWPDYAFDNCTSETAYWALKPLLSATLKACVMC